MPEDNPLVRDKEIAAVLKALGGCGAKGIQRQDLRRNELGVETIAQGVTTGCGCHQPQSVDWLRPVKGDDCKGYSAQCGNGSPDEELQGFVHARGTLWRI